MFTILVLALTLGVAVADLGRGYQYQVPVNPFGASSSQINNYKTVYSTSLNPTATYGRGSSLTTGTVGHETGSTIYKQGATVSSGFGGQASVVPSFSQSSKGSASQSSTGSYGNIGQGQGFTSSGVGSSSLTGSLGQVSVVPGTSFKNTATGLSTGGQSYIVSPVYNGQILSGNTGYNKNGFSSSSSSNFGVGSGSGYRVVNPSVLSTKYVTGPIGPSSNYNYYGTTGGTSSGFAVPDSGTGSNYNTVTSTGSNSAQQPSNTGSNSNYNTVGSGSNYYVPNQQGVYPGTTVGQNQGSYQTTVDTSALDNIGNYYQSASAANQFISSNQYQNAAILNYQDYYNQIQQQPAQVFKHFYVHAAPEDLEPPKPRPQIILPPPQKHYKIIFIKAPTQQPSVPQVIPVPQQNEEKTIVYVLVKKPEDAKNIVLPKFETKTPSKPDVFFIKYNDKQDSQSLIDNIVNDYNKGGVSASFTSISGGAPVSSASGYKSGSSFVSSTVNNNPVKTTGTTETLFGRKPNIVSPFGVSSTTPSPSFTSGSTLSPSSFESVFDYRFGNNVNSGSSITTSNLETKPSSSTLLTSSKPSVSFGSTSSNNLSSKPSIVSSSGYTSGSSSTSGSNTGILVTKPSTTILTGSYSSGSKQTTVPITTSIGNVPYGSGSSGIISGSKGSSVYSVNSNVASSKPSVNFGTGSSAVGGSSSSTTNTVNTFSKETNVLPSSSIGSSSSTPGYSFSTLNSRPSSVSSGFGSSSTSGYAISTKPGSSSGLGSVGITSGSFPSTTVSSTLSPVSNYVSKPIVNLIPTSSQIGSGSSTSSGFVSRVGSLPSGSLGSLGSSSGSSLSSTSYKPATTVISGSTLNNKPSNAGLSSSNVVSPALSLSNGAASSQSSFSYSSGTTLGSPANFGTGSSKFGAGLGSGSSNAGSTYETSLVSTSQGIPYETYGPPKFKVL